MAFSTKEQEIIKWGLQNGKTKEEVQNAITNLRTGYTPPQEQPPQENPSYLSKVAEAAKSGVERISQGLEQGQTTKSPIGAVESGIKTAEGTIQTVTSPLAPLLEPLQKLIGFISSKIAENPDVQKFAESDAGKTTARIAEDVSGLSTIAGTVAGGVEAPKLATGLSRAAQKTASSLQGIVDTGATGIQKATSAALDPAKIMQRVARIPKMKQAAFEQRAGQSVGQYLVDRGIFGNIEEITNQLFQNFQTARDTADAALAKLPGTFKTKPVETALNDLFAREARVSTPGALSKDFARVRQLKQKYEAEGLTMSEINEVKRLYERNVKVDYLKSQKPESVAKATTLDTTLRDWQRTQAEKLGLKNLSDINKETMLAKQLLDDLGREYAGSAGNNAITLSDWIILADLDPASITGFLAKKAFSSKGIQSQVAKALAPDAKQGQPFPIFERSNPITSYGDWIKAIEGGTTK